MLKSRIFNILERRGVLKGIDRWLADGLYGVILFNIFLLMIETMPSLESYGGVFSFLHIGVFFIFLGELILRIWVFSEYRKHHRHWSFWDFIFSPLMVCDMAVVIGYGMFLFFPEVFIDISFLRFFRVFRLFHNSRIISQAFRVIHRNGRDILMSFFLMFIVLSIASILVYYVEHVVQPEVFTSIPRTFWWGIVTFFTIGYGDMIPLTDVGKVIAGIMAFFGIAIFTLPASILGALFYNEFFSQKQKKFSALEQEVKLLRERLAGYEGKEKKFNNEKKI